MRNLIVFVLPVLLAAAPLTLYLDDAGRIASQVKWKRVTLGDPGFMWEGFASVITISRDCDEVTIYWHIDAPGPAWFDATLTQAHDDLYLRLSNPLSGLPDRYRAWSCWADVLEDRKSDESRILFGLMRRAGMNSRFERIER
jgi:hypothetical protein